MTTDEYSSFSPMPSGPPQMGVMFATLLLAGTTIAGLVRLGFSIAMITELQRLGENHGWRQNTKNKTWHIAGQL